MLQRAGYATGLVGKWHNGGGTSWHTPNKEIPPDADPAEAKTAAILREAQDALHSHVKRCGFDYAAAVNLGNFGSHVCRALRQHNQEWITKGALDFIERNKDRPFYLYMATSLMHGPSPLKSLKSDPRITHAGLLDKSLDVQPSRESVLKRAKAAGVGERLAPATWLDDGIGAVLSKLDALHLAEDTLVIFLNDHGVERGKGSCYEGGVRTPVVIRWKGRIKPGTSDALIQNVDFAPTILEACGVAPPRETVLDGKSLLPLLAGKVEKVHDSLYFEIGYTRAVCTERWKYLAFRIPPSRRLTPEQRKRLSQQYARRRKDREDKEFKPTPDAPLSHMGFPGGQDTERGNALKRYASVYHDADQLFDLKTDPGEKTNLASDPAHRATLEQMQGLLRRHLAGVPGTFAELAKTDSARALSGAEQGDLS
ncbi:MAG: sulfatase-like hydrolase/transferase, partial [Phycisphaerae bacterium]